MQANIIETITIVIYLAAMAAIGLALARKIKGSQDFLVAGRKLPIWLVTATLFATWWGGGTVLGGSGAAFHDGFYGVIYDPYGAGLTLILAGFFFMKIVHDAKVNTLAQFFSCRYGEMGGKLVGPVNGAYLLSLGSGAAGGNRQDL